MTWRDLIQEGVLTAKCEYYTLKQFLEGKSSIWVRYTTKTPLFGVAVDIRFESGSQYISQSIKP